MRLLWLVLAIGCGSSESVQPPPAPKLPVDVPQVTGIGFGPFDESLIAVVVNRDKVVSEGRAIVPIVDGTIDPAELEGRQGIKSPKLVRHTEALIAHATATKRPDRFALMFDRATPYRLMISVLYSMKSGGAKKFELIAVAGGEPVSVPLTLPDRRPSTAVAGDLRPRAGADLAAQIAAVREGAAKVRVGAGSTNSDLKLTASSITPESSLTIDQVRSKVISVYGGGLVRCARKSPGKQTLTIGFPIDATGRATQPTVKADPEVTTCVAAQITGWRFPVPRSGDNPVEVTASLTIEVDAPPPPLPFDETAARAFADETSVVPSSHPDDQPLGLFVTIRKDKLFVWSISKLEGSLATPRFSSSLGGDAIERLNGDLHDIVKRRWGGKPRPPRSTEIVIQADGAIPLQTVAEVIGAVRKTRDGGELFPDVMLSIDFE